MKRVMMPAFWWLLVVLALGVCNLVRADTSVSKSVGSATASANWSSVTVSGTLYMRFNWSVVGTANGASAGSASEIAVYSAASEGSFSGSNLFWRNSPTQINGGLPTSGTNDVVVTAGNWYRVAAYATAVNGEWGTPTSVWWQAELPPPKKVRISYFNHQEYPVNIKLVDAADPETVLGSMTVAPKTGIIQTFTLPTGVDAVKLLVEVNGFEWDGTSWVVDEEAVTEIEVPGDPIDGEEEPSDTVVNEPDGLPGGKAPTPDLPADDPRPEPWNQTAATVDNERLDKATYRQGVDKLGIKLEAIHKAMTEGTAPDMGEEEPGALPEPTEIPAPTLSLVPETPTFFSGSFGSSHTISADLPAISALGASWPARTFSLDLSDYSASIEIVRGVCSVCLVIGFFLLSVRTARGSSATE